MAEEDPKANTVVNPRLIALRRKAGRPVRHVPTREQVLMELWGDKKMTVARVTALKCLLDELNKGPQYNHLGEVEKASALPPWMLDNAAAE